MNKGLCLIAALVIAACERQPSEQVVERLNGPEYRPPTAVTSVIKVDARPGAGRTSYAAAIGTLRQTASYSYSLKSSTLPPHQASLAPDGSLLFVDEFNPEVFRIAADGKIGSVFPPGTPWEFQLRGPIAVLPLGTEHWVVVDRTMKLKVFSLERDQLVPVRIVRIPDASDACVMGNSIVVRGDDKPLQRFSLDDGTRVRKYGKVFSHPSRLVRTTLAEGLVGCRDEESPVITMSTAFSYIYGYAPDGTASWLTKVEGLDEKPMSLVKYDDGKTAVRSEGANYDVPSRLMPLDGDRVLFQFVRVQREPVVATQVHSFILSARSGQGEYIGTELPRVIGGTWPNLITVNPESRTVAVNVAASLVARNPESRPAAIHAGER